LVKDFKPEGVLGGGTDSLTLAIFAHFNIGADFQNDFGREFHAAGRDFLALSAKFLATIVS